MMMIRLIALLCASLCITSAIQQQIASILAVGKNITLNTLNGEGSLLIDGLDVKATMRVMEVCSTYICHVSSSSSFLSLFPL
jgi:hypothetical protein